METLKPCRQEVSKHIEDAFEFIQKLYFEASYLVKEIEGQLASSDQKFQILKPYGYGINTSKSMGLEINYVRQWLLRKFSIAFVEEKLTKINGGVSTTSINPQLKILFFKIVLNEKDKDEPKLIFGIIYDIKIHGKHTKFENLMSHLEYYDYKVFNKLPDVFYESTHFRLRGKFRSISLLELNSSEGLVKKVIVPILKMYDEVQLTSEIAQN